MALDSNNSASTILIADDNRDMVDSTAMMLEDAGYSVLKAYSAGEALNHLDEHSKIALVISDIRMPEVDGFDLLRVVRYRFASMPVVLITGNPVTNDDVVPHGAAILRKPFTYDALQRALSALLAAQPQTDEKPGRTHDA